MKISFGTAADGPTLQGGQTTFEPSTSPCPEPGQYSLLRLTFNCYENTWHTISGDHTSNGYYMLVNCQSVVGDIFVYTVKGLCPNTSYELSSWIQNVLRPTACSGDDPSPNLKMTVETRSGNIIASYTSGALSKEKDPGWKQHGIVFSTTTTETEFVIRIKNTASADCGNVLAIDDITVRPTGPKVSVVVASNGASNIEVCEGTSAAFLLTSTYESSYTNPSFQWQVRQGNSWQNIAGANARNYTTQASPAGIYSYRMLISRAQTSAHCGIASNDVAVNIQRAPFVQATNYVYGCLGGEVTLMASGGINYYWTGPQGYTSTSQTPVLPQVRYTDSGIYKVTGTNQLGCKSSDSTILRVYPNATAISGAGTFICEGASTTLSAGGGLRYEWSPRNGLSGDTIASPRASPTENTLYTVKVTNQYGCSDTASIKINVWKKPVADAGPDLKTRVGMPISLRGSVSGSDVSFKWTPSANLSAPNRLNPVTSPAQTTTYTLHVTSSHGCGTSTDDVVVKVFDKITVPNAFSPNGDGINDTWKIEPLDLFDDSVTEVYNRYGQAVYRTRGYSTPWNGTNNGKPIPAGTYYYVIDLRIHNQPLITGSITILR